MKDAYLTDEQFNRWVAWKRSDASRVRDEQISERPRGRCCVFFVAAQHDHEYVEGIKHEQDELIQPVIQFHDGQYWLVINDDRGYDACGLPIHFCPWCGNYTP